AKTEEKAKPAPAAGGDDWATPPPALDDSAPEAKDEEKTAPAAPTDDSTRPFGPGSVLAEADGSGPEGWLKGNADSMIFHTADSPAYDSTDAEVWFESEEHAKAAGFRHW
ncbi:sunset domain-containing protein, partial [Luteipulveratus flavus]|nr:50S ribosomal protein L17 [Luteipulveratus sp. YIM 133296]